LICSVLYLAFLFLSLFLSLKRMCLSLEFHSLMVLLPPLFFLNMCMFLMLHILPLLLVDEVQQLLLALLPT
jgi:hypothetical protein